RHTRFSRHWSQTCALPILVAPVAARLGMEIEDVAALTAMLGNAGLQGTVAGTALRTILTSLAAPTGAAAKAISELKIQTVDAAEIGRAPRRERACIRRRDA